MKIVHTITTKNFWNCGSQEVWGGSCSYEGQLPSFKKVIQNIAPCMHNFGRSVKSNISAFGKCSLT
jgi:hypothetical protein